MRTITTREQLLEVPNGTLMVDRDGNAMTRTHEGEFALWAVDERKWRFYSVGEIDGTLVHEGESQFFPIECPDQDPQSAETWFLQSAERRAAAATSETKATLLLLATLAHEEFPDAVGIELENSDQGDYYCIQGVLDADGENVDEDLEFDGNTGYVYSLDDTVFDVIQPFCVKNDDGTDKAYVDRRYGLKDTVLDIAAILEGVKPGG